MNKVIMLLLYMILVSIFAFRRWNDRSGNGDAIFFL
jgi:hypothetical protein